MRRELALGGLADGADPFGQIVQTGEVVLVDLLEQLVQRAERHASDVPVEILPQPRRDDRLGERLVQRRGDLGAGVRGKVGSFFGHVGLGRVDPGKAGQPLLACVGVNLESFYSNANRSTNPTISRRRIGRACTRTRRRTRNRSLSRSPARIARARARSHASSKD